MSDINIDFTGLFYGLWFGLAGPVVASILTEALRGWRRVVASTLAGPGLATLAGMAADLLVPDGEIALLSLLAGAVVQLPFSLRLLWRRTE